MGVFSYVKLGKKIFGKKSPTIKSVKPTFPKTKMSQALRDVKMTALKTKGSIKKSSQDMDRDIQKVKSKLGQTMQKLKGEPVTKSGVSKGKDLREKKMGGGMMGRRFGYKGGSNGLGVVTTDITIQSPAVDNKVNQIDLMSRREDICCILYTPMTL